MRSLAIFLCSFRRDLLRAVRQIESIQAFNVDRLPVWVAVPLADMDFFRQHIPSGGVHWVTQEEVFAQTPSSRAVPFDQIPGGIAQQVVKADAWRLEMAQNLLVTDSDCLFLRPFQAADFFNSSGVLKTVVYREGPLQEFARVAGTRRIRREVFDDYDRTVKACRRAIGAPVEPAHPMHIGGAPFLWSRDVWMDLEKRVLTPGGRTLLDLILEVGSEFIIYGETVLAFRAIPIVESPELFRIYHYPEQFWSDQLRAVGSSTIARDHFGVVRQSNWDRGMDYPGTRGDTLSHMSWRLRSGIRWVRWRCIEAVGRRA